MRTIARCEDSFYIMNDICDIIINNIIKYPKMWIRVGIVVLSGEYSS